MATLSLPLPGGFLIDEAIGLMRRARPPACARPFVEVPRAAAVPGAGSRREIVVKIASEPDEWEQAFQLVAANYQERGYETTTDKPYRFTPYHALPDTTIFVAKHEGRVVATFSLVPITPSSACRWNRSTGRRLPTCVGRAAAWRRSRAWRSATWGRASSFRSSRR